MSATTPERGVRRLARYEDARRTVMHILASRHVAQCCIGITGNPTQRKRAYSRWCRENDAQLDGFVLLGWEHSADEIVRFERWLFEKVHKHRKYSNSENVKYFPNVNRRYAQQVIYLAWWSPAFWPPA